jgi:hypothetical protein
MADLTPEQWRERLEHELEEAQPVVSLCSAYYAGQHRLQFATSKFREAFGDLFEAFATNWCGLVVDVAVERLGIQGFRFGDDDADDDAWKMWQDNAMDAKSLQVHTEAVKCGTAYLIVGPPRAPGGSPVITVEAPNQVIVAHDPSDRSIRLAALKKYVAANGDPVCVVYLPDRVVEFRRSGARANLEVMGVEIVGTAGGDWEVWSDTEHPLGVVPVVPLENAPDLVHGGTSDLRPAIALNDAANKFFTDMIHASEFTSFPQRILTGVELPRDPVTKEVLSDAQVRAAVSRLWAFESPDASVTQLAVGDLSSYVEGVDLAVQHLAAQTRTPPHYLLAKLANLSGDALKAAETGLVARCKRKHLDFSDGHEEAMRLAFRWRAIDREQRGDADGAVHDRRRAEMLDAETIWTDPESKNPVALAQMLTQKQAIGVPWKTLMEEAGYSPQQIKRMERLRKLEQQEAQARAEAEAAAAKADAEAENANPGTYAGGKPIVVESTPTGVTVIGLPGPPSEDVEAA